MCKQRSSGFCVSSKAGPAVYFAISFYIQSDKGSLILLLQWVMPATRRLIGHKEDRSCSLHRAFISPPMKRTSDVLIYVNIFRTDHFSDGYVKTLWLQRFTCMEKAALSAIIEKK